MVLFQMEPAVHHISIVVSPLKALMQGQAAEWEARGVRCAILSEDKLSDEARNGMLKPEAKGPSRSPSITDI